MKIEVDISDEVAGFIASGDRDDVVRGLLLGARAHAQERYAGYADMPPPIGDVYAVLRKQIKWLRVQEDITRILLAIEED